ncbi:calcium-binding protein [Chelatococcus reniformis]|uniref:Calcium-binding protein n=1 Tax=Chelatococcus reniformis TaxID=1494448 RepID=A0A916UBT5_9HYPH|nr:hypothetical protein [Chelatococcus reniformis]GGC67678.1 hypothetical protein GCM10010994_27860 [Chelatococcus reniformis]
MATYDLTTAQVEDLVSASGPADIQAATLAALQATGVINESGVVVTEGGAGSSQEFNTLSPGAIFLGGGEGGTADNYRIDVVATDPAGSYLNAGDVDYYGLLAWGEGSDTVQGGSGDFQTLVGFQGDTLITGTGTNQIAEAHGGATAYVTDGNLGASAVGSNTIFGGLNEGDSSVLLSYAGTSGNSLLQVFQGNNTLLGQSGSDTLIGGTGQDVLIAGLAEGAHDLLVLGSGGGQAQVVQGNNVLISTGGADSLFGGAGEDSLFGGGQSYLFAGTGGTDLFGQGGDTLFSGAGDDYLQVTGSDAGTFYLSSSDTGGGNDTVVGGDGADQFFVGSVGNNTIMGGEGDDTVSFYNYTADQATITHNEDGSTMYQFGSGDTAQSVLVYDVQNIIFKSSES